MRPYRCFATRDDTFFSMASRKQTAYVVPGFGLPLRWQQHYETSEWVRHSHNTFLNSALDGSEEGSVFPLWCLSSYSRAYMPPRGDGADPLTVAERQMLSLINDLTDEYDWDRNIYQQHFIEKWKSRCLPEEHVTPQMADWVGLDSLRSCTLFESG